MSKRTTQIGEELRRVIQEVIARGLSDPRIAGLITITNVKVSEDLRSASVGVSVFPQEKEALTMHGLRAASRHIRRRAGDLMAMARLPELEFEVDQSIRQHGDVLRAIARAREEFSAAEGHHEQAPSNRIAPQNGPPGQGLPVGDRHPAGPGADPHLSGADPGAASGSPSQ